jgi:hypothetical protein
MLIETSLNYDTRSFLFMEGMKTIILQYIKEFKEVYYGHRPISNPDIEFPCVMIEPININQSMVTTAKTELTFPFTLYFYLRDNGRDGLVQKQLDCAEALGKLFSNNALSDLQTATPTHKFKRWYNPPTEAYWYDSEIRDINLSPTFVFGVTNKEWFCRAGRMTIDLKDRLIR